MKPKSNKRSLGSDGSATPRSLSKAPGTPAPNTPQHKDQEEGQGEERKPPKKPRKQPQELGTLTPLQKAEDMCKKLLKKKSDASNLALTLQALPYCEQLRVDMNKFAGEFEFLNRVIL